MGIFCSTILPRAALFCLSSEFRSAAKEKEEVLFLSAIVKGLIYHLTMEDTIGD